jgi:hypothetical protein
MTGRMRDCGCSRWMLQELETGGDELRATSVAHVDRHEQYQ